MECNVKNVGIVQWIMKIIIIILCLAKYRPRLKNTHTFYYFFAMLSVIVNCYLRCIKADQKKKRSPQSKMFGREVVTGVSCLLALTSGIKVLTTPPYLEQHSFAEISNSSLAGYSELTVCGRFLTDNFPPVPYPLKYTVISVDGLAILGEPGEHLSK